METCNVASKDVCVSRTTVLAHNSLQSNGRITRPGFSHKLIKPLIKPIASPVKNKIVYAKPSSNHWSSTEGHSHSSWYVYFNDGYFTYYKYNGLVVRPCVALDSKEIEGWIEAFYDCCERKKSTIQCSIYRSRY